MGYNEGEAQVQVELAGAPQRFMQKLSFTGTGGLTTLQTTTQDGRSLPVSDGSCLALQADQDFFFELVPTATVVSAVTDYAGARPGTKVFAGQIFYVYKSANDQKIDVVRSSASGTLAIFLVHQ